MADSQGNDNNTCVVCFKNVLYYSIGECDHPVCFECSTRMRVLCLQNECPICRQDLSRVVFTESILPYKELRNQVFTDRFFERQFKIGFSNQDIKNAYDKLLENCCKICENIPPFRTFTMLSDHMRKVHERYFCDLCVKHLKIFTAERKCYTRQELAHHRRKGDLDDTSHRGHPLCEFCEERFMDADELYRHLRKEHLYCHLCDADGRNLYYASHSALAQHFRTDHYLCEDGECAGQHLTAVFRSEIDLKAHKATVHGRGMTRGAARQARTLELQFNITPHPVASRTPRDRDRERERERDRDRERERREPSPPVQANIDTRNDEQFPRLAASDAPHPTLLLGGPSRAYRGRGGLLNNEQNFPALDGAAATRPVPAPSAIVRNNSKPSFAIQVHSQPASASNFRLTQTSGHRAPAPQPHPQPQRRPHSQLSDDDFPSLGGREDHLKGGRDDHPSIGAGTVQQPKVTLINSQEMSALSKPQSSQQQQQQQARRAQPPLGADAFPALPSAPAPAPHAPHAPAQWITVSKNKEKPRLAKPEPPSPPREPTFNPVADFPTLPVNKSKPKKYQPPPQPNPPPAQPEPKPTKKQKNKQNNTPKKENISELAYVPVHVNGVIDKKMAKELSYVAASAAPPVADKKIKTVESSSTVAVGDRNGGTGDFKMTARDYPPLNPRGDSAPPPPPPQYRKTPNGKLAAPPGFKARPACGGMTFTNSAGQTFPAPVHAYVPPPDFEKRNRALVKKFAVALGGAAAVEDFKVASRAFRDNIISAEEFYQHCRQAVGSQLDTVFPELVALLPDIAKQQELVVGRNMGSALEVCSTCGQLVVASDRIAHDSVHWPALN